MANLTITEETRGLKFVDGNSGSNRVFNNFSYSRYDSLEEIKIISNIEETFAEFEIIFDDYTAVTYEGAAVADVDALELLLDAYSTGSSGSVDSFNGRTGVVVPAINDYSKEQIAGLKTTDSPEFDNLTLDDWAIDDASLRGIGIGQPRLMMEFASATNPTIIPFGVNTESGMGRGAINAPSMIANSIEVQRWSETSGTPSTEIFGNAKIGGALNLNVTTVNTATYSLLATDYILHVTYTSTGDCTITIPTAQIVDGRVLNIKNAIAGTANNVIVNTEGSEQIEFESNLTIISGDSVSLYVVSGNLFAK